jgi:AraC family transcriptional regulator
MTWTGLAIAYTMRNREPGSVLSYEWLCQELAAHLLARYAWSPARMPAIRGQLPGATLKQVLDYIEAEPAADLRLGTLAELAHLSEFHFARQFHKTVGRTLHQVVLEQRLKKSYGLVLNTRLGLAEVAAEAGFADESHFVKRFKRVYGITPRELRKDAGSPT